MALLTEVFAIDIAAYTVMSNHYHLVLHVDSDKAAQWTDDEVLQRWTRIFKGPTLIRRYLAGAPLHATEELQLQQLITSIREKLSSISKFMSCLNYHIARMANAEDGCTGRFWEGRFKSQALLDETALLSCMAYVDLNPIRAGIARNLEESDFTSIQDRIKQLQSVQKSVNTLEPTPPTKIKPKLMYFNASLQISDKSPSIPYQLKDYLQLADWTGRIVRSDKKESIAQNTPKLLQTLGLSEDQWSVLALQIQKQSIAMLHGLERLEQLENKAAKKKAA